MLTRRIVCREVVTFSWRCETHVPMFQFDRTTWSIHAGVLTLLAELAPVFDDQEVARWFVQPNQWLGDVLPHKHLSHDFNAVLHAARTDRFVAAG